jgi:hypothetical protein
MTETNSLLRSAYAIACRKGKDTNWEAFARNVKAELFKQAEIPGCKDEQTGLRATCTAKTYHMVQDGD